jgi:hypothetical protein
LGAVVAVVEGIMKVAAAVAAADFPGYGLMPMIWVRPKRSLLGQVVQVEERGLTVQMVGILRSEVY